MEKKVGVLEKLGRASRALSSGLGLGLGFRTDLGKKGERIAARELERRGYRVLERRWRTKRGEIDIIAEDGGVLVIVEVKTRTRTDVARPVDAVDGRKQRALSRLAQAYVKSRRLEDVTVRFDVVGVHLPLKGARSVEVLPNAFPFTL